MNALTLPVVVPLLGGILLLLFKTPRRRAFAGAAAALGTLLASSLVAYRALGGEVLSTQLGGWPAPYGITLVADGLTGLMLLQVGS